MLMNETKVPWLFQEIYNLAVETAGNGFLN